MKLSWFLESLWMNKTEREVFLACSKYPNSSISSLARITDIPRSTINDTVQRLVSLGYIIPSEQQRWFTYTSLSYEGIKANLVEEKLSIDKKMAGLDAIKNEFEKIAILDHSFTNINHYQWPNTVSLIYTKLAKAKILRAFFNPAKSVEYSNYSVKDLSSLLIKNQIDSREILTENSIAREYAKNLQVYKKHQTRFIKEESMNNFQADYLIVDDSFYFIAFSEEIMAIEINNKIFVDAQKIIFDQLWERL